MNDRVPSGGLRASDKARARFMVTKAWRQSSRWLDLPGPERQGWTGGTTLRRAKGAELLSAQPAISRRRTHTNGAGYVRSPDAARFTPVAPPDRREEALRL